MADKDKAEKSLEYHNDVFADIVNVLLFDGKSVVEPDKLTEAVPVSQYNVDGKLHEQERDIAKYWHNSNIKIAFYGVENQTSIDKDMPLRVMSYDGVAYRNQLNVKKHLVGSEKRYPVVTLVLYFGQAPWRGNKLLSTCLDIPKELRPYVGDYRINVFDIPRLSEAKVKLFRSDFKIVADYFVQMNKYNNYVPGKEKIRHVREVLTMLSVLSGDSKYEKAFESIEQSDLKGGVTMSNFLDKAEERGVIKGEAKGKKETEDVFAKLALKLKELGRVDELFQATVDAEYRAKLLKEFSIAN